MLNTRSLAQDVNQRFEHRMLNEKTVKRILGNVVTASASNYQHFEAQSFNWYWAFT